MNFFNDEYNHQDKTLSYCSALSTYLDLDILDCVYLRVYTAKRKKSYSDTHTFYEKMYGSDSLLYIEGMRKEVS